MSKLEEAKEILSSLKVPAKQQNGMCCCVLFAMANLTEEETWGSAANIGFGFTMSLRLQTAITEQPILKGEKRAARELVLAEIPDDKIIYKYFRGINRDFDTIKVPELWLCNAYRLNDPFDCAFVKGHKEIDEYIRNRADSINMQNKTFISCFSEKSDSMIMWGTYANCHRGICVGYSLKELVEKFNCLPVVYEETLPQYTNDTSVLINTLTKYIDWKYEHEWRIVEINDKQRNEVGYKIKFVKPKEIILGLKSNDFLWKINNTGKSSDEIKPDELIRYSEDILGTDCFQYQITTSDKGYKWEKIIRI